MASAAPESLREHTASRLPTYRHVDIPPITAAGAGAPLDPDARRGGHQSPVGGVSSALSTAENNHYNDRRHTHHSPQHQQQQAPPPPPRRGLSVDDTAIITTTTHQRRDSSLTSPPRIARHLTFPADIATQSPGSPRDQGLAQPATAALSPRATAPAATSTVRKDKNGPPLSMITQGHYDVLSPTTHDWVQAQSKSLSSPTLAHKQNDAAPASPAGLKSTRPLSTLIKPIRGFKPSSRRQSLEMSSRRNSDDAESTVRVERNNHTAAQHRDSAEQDEQNSDESDLFLRAAREEEQLSRQSETANGDMVSHQADISKSRIGSRGSATLLNTATSRRRGSDNEDTTMMSPMTEQENLGQAMNYRTDGRHRPSAFEDMNKSRYYGGSTRSTPTTPRVMGGRELSPPESQASYGGRRPSVPDASLPSRSTYRASNLSYTTPRTYSSSPLVSRTTDINVASEAPRAADGTESTVSTTAPSTVWDELEDLKSRIHRLELTGKLPATSGAAMNRAANDRPPTATTTATTMSSSPKRGRANSTSPTEQTGMAAVTSEAHPLLQAALLQSKDLLGPVVYKALEASTSDALALSMMMGSSGQPGPISSSQSVIGGPASVTDRQVRRKVDSLCRSLTELCLTLTEGNTESQAAARPSSQDNGGRTLVVEPSNTQRPIVNADVARAQSSPRTLSRLEARRSSLLAGSGIPSPRYNPSESDASLPSTTAGRRTSLLIRSRRGTEEAEEEDETRFRAPSRAATEVNQLGNSARAYTSQQPLHDRQYPSQAQQTPRQQAAVQSYVPVRRHYATTSLPAPASPPVTALEGRRYLDRSTPERESSKLAGRLAEERSQRKSSIGQAFGLGRTGSLTRRVRQPSSADYSPASRTAAYQ